MRLHCLLPLLSAGIFLTLTISAAQERNQSPVSASNSGNKAESSKTANPVIRSSTNLVTVDVVVSHDGQPVKGLQQQSFRILEDGREQTVKVFEEHGPGVADANAQKRSALPPNTYTNAPDPSNDSAMNVLLLDIVNTPTEDQAYGRRKIIEYLKTIPSGTHLAVFTLASRLRLVQDFTADSSILLAAVEKIVPTQSVALVGNRGETAADRFSAQASATVQGANSSTLDKVVESLHQFDVDEESNLLDRRAQITLDALKQIGAYLSAFPGRKNLIWFSASFPLSVTPKSPLDSFTSLRGYGPQLQEISDLLTASRVAVYPVDARGLITSVPSPDSRNRPQAVRVLRSDGIHAPVVSHPNPIELSDPVSQNNAEFATMLQLAEQTGGTPFYNSNAIKRAIAEAIENGSSYYTLAYSPEDKNFDGKFRKIQVKLAGREYHLAYRHGYFADAPSAHSSALLSPTAAALGPNAPQASQILFRARVLPAGDSTAQKLDPQPGPAGTLAEQLKPPVQRYWIEFTADMRQVSAEQDSSGVYHSMIEFIAIAYDHDGKVVNVNRRGFKLGMPPAKYNELLQMGYSARTELDLPPGEVLLRLAVHDIAADRVGSIAVPVRTVVTKASN